MRIFLIYFVVMLLLGCNRPIEQQKDTVSEKELITLPTEETQIERSITIEELKQHNVEDDCWVGYEGKAYDITLFLGKHKQGLVNFCGTYDEFSQAFASKHGNSKVSVLVQESSLIGNIK